MKSQYQAVEEVIRGRSRLIAILLLLFVSFGCTPIITPPPPLPVELDFPAAYRVESTGIVDIDGIELRGGARLDYLVYPSGRVIVTQFDGWISDVDIVVNFLWWETNRERLRCNSVSSVDAIPGRISGTRIDFDAASATFSGLSFEQRSSTGGCPGLARVVDATNDGPFVITHDPDREIFSLTAAFRATHDGNTVPLRFQLEGEFLNRPPVASIGVADPGVPWQRIEEGCPLNVQDFPVLVANRPEGLVLNLRSLSYDNDSRASEVFQVKFPRGDISTEQWAHSVGGKYDYLGEGRLLGPVLFRTGIRHALMLTVTDRTGAKARQVCRFEVVAS